MRQRTHGAAPHRSRSTAGVLPSQCIRWLGRKGKENLWVRKPLMRKHLFRGLGGVTNGKARFGGFDPDFIALETWFQEIPGGGAPIHRTRINGVGLGPQV